MPPYGIVRFPRIPARCPHCRDPFPCNRPRCQVKMGLAYIKNKVRPR